LQIWVEKPWQRLTSAANTYVQSSTTPDSAYATRTGGPSPTLR